MRSPTGRAYRIPGNEIKEFSRGLVGGEGYVFCVWNILVVGT